MNEYIKPKKASELSGISVAHLSQMRHRGGGPRYYKPSPGLVFYTEADIREWIEASARYGTAEAS